MLRLLEKNFFYFLFEIPDLCKKVIELAHVVYRTKKHRFIMDDNELAFSSINVGYRFRDTEYKFLRECSIQALNLDLTTNDLGRLSTIAMERGLDYPFARTYTLTLSIVFK